MKGPAHPDRGYPCPKCGTRMTVTDSRPSEASSKTVRRRRVCGNCRHRITTFEIPHAEYEHLRGVTLVADQMLKLADTLSGHLNSIKKIMAGNYDG